MELCGRKREEKRRREGIRFLSTVIMGLTNLPKDHLISIRIQIMKSDKMRKLFVFW
jgi:hypothetical protein